MEIIIANSALRSSLAIDLPSHDLNCQGFLSFTKFCGSDSRARIGVGMRIIQRMLVIFVYCWTICCDIVEIQPRRDCVCRSCWKILVNGLDLGSLKLWTDFKTANTLLKAWKTLNRRQQILSLAWHSRTNF